MDKKNIKQVSIYSLIGIIVFVAVSFGSYKFYKVQAYNKLISSANKYMEEGNYEKAIDVFNEALEYKEDSNVKNSVILAKSLLASQKYYEEGVKEMKKQDYEKAIDSFKKVVKEDTKRYEDARKKIDECTKAFIALNLKNASEAAKNSKYEEANKYLDEILKIDSANKEAKKLKEDYSTASSKKQQGSEDKDKGYSAGVTADQAVKIAAKYVTNKGTNTKFSFDHEDSRNGVNYYVIHAFEDMGDHVATLGWYYIEKGYGKAYEWDLAEDQLIPLN
ncbi:hypothetical protein N4T77_14220 [Clostridium sp. CX1]|uniref:Tetratricopeptide repeat protein n=1 Tax=Clostridium tanneri TaxID=3037988 RepID=A0ABU4JSH6_9CLOT|nr:MULTISPECIES: hypothetical protein [unclassified Clostridium]MCT8977752.1 hypothetical protein [Clostridium sp. CX1]MDW8800888.1 hypothetical protein [Clostridium sp. A1-XYC3]